MNFLILRANQFSGDHISNKFLGDIPDQVLAWQLGVANQLDLVPVIVESKATRLDKKPKFDNVILVDNRNPANTGPMGSVFCARPVIRESVIVSYGDVLVHSDSIEKLLKAGTDISFLYDSKWVSRFPGISEDYLYRSEKARHDSVSWLFGRDLPIDPEVFEFVGIVFLSSRALEVLDALARDNFVESAQYYLNDAIRILLEVDSSLTLSGIDVAGNWAQVHIEEDVTRFILSTKGKTLERLSNQLCKSVVPKLLRISFENWMNDRAWCLEKLYMTFEGKSVAVRSSANFEDSFEGSSAGVYDTFLNVTGLKSQARHVDNVFASYSCPVGEEVVVQKMVESVVASGVLFSRTLSNSAPWFCISISEGEDTSQITTGNSGGETWFVSRCFDGPFPNGLLGVILGATQEVESVTAYDELDIEFAISESDSFNLLQTRPLVSSTKMDRKPDHLFFDLIRDSQSLWEKKRNQLIKDKLTANPIFSVMTDWNPAEIIGVAPKRLAWDLYKYLVTDTTWAIQRFEAGYHQVSCPLLVDLMDRPYVDVTESLRSFIPRGMSESATSRLLDFYLTSLNEDKSLHDKVEFEIALTCVTPNFDSRLGSLREKGVLSNQELDTLKESLRQITVKAIKFIDNFEFVDERYVHDSFGELPAYLNNIRINGVLPFAHAARCAFVAVSIIRDSVAAGLLSREGAESFFSGIRTVAHEIQTDAALVKNSELSLSKFITKYGHLRPGTYEISSLRYDADLEKFMLPMIKNAIEGASADDTIHSQWEIEKGAVFEFMKKELGCFGSDVLERFLYKAIELRELLKFKFTESLSDCLRLIEHEGSRLGLSKFELSHMPLVSVFKMAESNIGDIKAEIADQEAKFDVRTAVAAPDVINCVTDLSCFKLGQNRPNFLGLTTVCAPIMHLETSDDVKLNRITGKIVMIEQADPGFDWLFTTKMVGLITKYGGANSHMSIRCAEFGLTSAIGVGEQIFRSLASAKLVEIDPSNKTIRPI